MINRREFIKVSIAASLFSGLGACRSSVRWEQAAYRKQATSRVAILEAKSYQTSLKDIINRGVHLLKLDVKGKRIVLKPNLVEFDPAGVINTHPAVIEAAIDSFRSLGAREVVVAEGPGHRRDSEYLLTASGIYDVIREHRVRYVDLNTDDVRLTELRSDFTNLRQLYFPETLFNADLLVSMPKLKTHHWAGVTLSLKNMFGVIPGSVYGWPKNILHWAGIDRAILDINAAVGPDFAIVDGIMGMEGNGPIQGTPKECGVLVLGDNPVAVDATCCRVMGINPVRVKYLARAGTLLGHVEASKIQQRGESIASVRKPFAVLDAFREVVE